MLLRCPKDISSLRFPELVFYQPGVDGLASDALGHLALTHAGLIKRDRTVMQTVRAHSVPLVLTSGGGYSRPIELSAQAHANIYRTAWEIFAGGPAVPPAFPGSRQNTCLPLRGNDILD